MSFLDNSFKLTVNQFNAVSIGVEVANEIVLQASPNDNTPLEVSYGELLEVAGKVLGKRISSKV